MDYEHQLVSIIMPIYNMEAYLDECIKSIIGQTYSNWELILLDDGSNDGSVEVCNKWAKKDERIRLFQNTNHGVSYTRNLGLSLAKGRFVLFIDSDDIVLSNYIQRLVELNDQYNTDLTMVSYFSFAEDGEVNELSCNLKDTKQVVLESDIETAFFSVSQGTICSKLYRLDLIRENGISFDEKIFVSEDLLFNSMYADCCKNAIFENSKLYGYRQRVSSAVHNSKSIKWFSCLDAYSVLFDRYKNSAAFSFIIYHYLKNLYEAKYIIKKQQLKQIDIRPSLDKEICTLEQESKMLTLKQKIRLFICKHLFGLVEMRRKK